MITGMARHLANGRLCVVQACTFFPLSMRPSGGLEHTLGQMQEPDWMSLQLTPARTSQRLTRGDSQHYLDLVTPNTTAADQPDRLAGMREGRGMSLS